RSAATQPNRWQLMRNMRSNNANPRPETLRSPVVRWMTALTLTLSLSPGAIGQTAPQFPTNAPTGASTGAGESKVEAYPLTAATRDVLNAWQQRAAGRTDMRVAIDERTSQALVFAPPSVQAQIKQELAARSNIAPPPVAAPVAGPI